LKRRLAKEQIMTTFNWLHLTDLHLGAETHYRLWPNVEEDLFEDLEFVVRKVGSLDLVVFTGDLAYRGSSEEFDLVTLQLERLWDKFNELDFEPKLLAVPGNHDLVRPDDAADPALITLLRLWEEREVQEPFWNNADSGQRRVVDEAFANYMEWWHNVSVPKPTIYTRGILPGDFAATLEKDGLKLGILGLNTSFLQLTDGDFKGKLALDVLQFHEACSGHGPDWVKKHDANLLLTHHHSPDWLTEKAKEQLDGEIYRERRFAVHLFGHLHEPDLRSVAVGGADAHRRLQGCSLFAIEGWGEHKQEPRIHGYSVGQLRINGDIADLRICPRRAVRRQGGWNIERDTSFTLPKDESMTEVTPITLLRSRTGSVLVPTDEEQRRAKAAREAFQVALDMWRNDGMPEESARKLDWFYQNHQALDLTAEGLIFLLLSQNLLAHSSSFGASTSSRVTRTRWVDSVDPIVCRRAVNHILELRESEDLDQDLAHVMVSDVCSASSLEVQKKLVKHLESHPEGTLLAQAYGSSTIPNEATLRYLQDVALLQTPVISKRAVVYRILEHYRRVFAPFIGRQLEDLRGSFPRRLLENTSFRDAAFYYLDETSDSRRRVAFAEYKLELLQMVYGHDPSRTTEALWKMVRLDVFYIGETTRKALQLLRLIDPERTVRQVVAALREVQRYYSDESITILEFLEAPEADELLIGNIRRYAERFAGEFRGGSKRWKGRYLQYWRASLRQTVQAAVHRNLGAIRPYLMAIVLRHEPANVNVSCVNALIAVGSEEEVWPILVKLLNDRYSQVRNLCAKHLLKLKQYRHQTIEQLIEELSDGSDPEWPFLSNRHKKVMLVKIELLRKLQDSNAVEILSSIASSEKDKEIANVAAKAAAALK
jgi:hypothetical protein